KADACKQEKNGGWYETHLTNSWHMCIPNRLSSNVPNVTLCESSVKVICGKSPRIINMCSLANLKALASMYDDKI
ncbi:MAG: hypothetical protein ACPH9U_07830, partial [Candidatus Puniceispirillaceae bacterium]